MIPQLLKNVWNDLNQQFSGILSDLLIGCVQLVKKVITVVFHIMKTY